LFLLQPSFHAATTVMVLKSKSEQVTAVCSLCCKNSLDFLI
jgi:hypothetical protein